MTVPGLDFAEFRQTHYVDYENRVPGIKEMTDEDLVKHFREEAFNAPNFLFVFEHLEHFLDVDNSSALGKFYLSSKFLAIPNRIKSLADV